MNDWAVIPATGMLDGILPTIITDVLSSAAALEVSVEPDLYLASAQLISLSEQQQ